MQIKIIIEPLTLRKKCPYSELFCSVFSRIWNEYREKLREILGISPIQPECGKMRTRTTLRRDTFHAMYSNNIELIDLNSVTEQEMESFPKEFLELMWTNWQKNAHLFTHLSKKHSKESLHSCLVSFIVFTT